MFFKWLKRRHPYLGLDIGTTTVKAAIYRNRKFIAADVPAPPNGLADPQAMVAAIGEAVSRTGWRGRQVVTAVSGDRLIIRYLRLPQMTAAELKAGMVYEIENYLPTGTRDMVVDWAVLNSGDELAAGEMLVLLAAAPREQVNLLCTIVRDAGLELAAVDLVPLALCRVLAREDARALAIIDIGSHWSTIVLARSGLPYFSRVINIGGETITQPEIGGYSFMNELIQEIRRSLEFYRTQSGTAFNPACLVLTGGGAQTEGLVDFCQQELGMVATIGRPGIIEPQKQLSPALAVAAGLALRERTA